jgi:transcriptional regulator with XRE-family HTH domain
MSRVVKMNARMRRLIAILRSLRKARGFTCAEVGEYLGYTPSMISRLETGLRGLRRDDMVAMLAVYRVTRAFRDAMVALFEAADQPGLLDRGELNVHEDLATWIGFEEDATDIRNYEPLLIPGLLQTIPYARALFGGGDPRLTAADMDARVSARVARQVLLREPDPPQLQVILHQAALHQKVGGAQVMRGQLEYLVEVARLPNVTIRVIPADSNAHPGMNGPFVIMDYFELPSLVHLENKVASLYLEEKEDVETYRLAFDGLVQVALPLDRSADLIRRIAAGLR